METNFVRIKEVKRATGLSKTTIYDLIKLGLYTRSIKLGRRAAGWPWHEVKVLNAARLAGKSEDQIHLLVAQLEAQRLESIATGLVS